MERPTRREQRREQTVREIRALAIGQITTDGPDAVSLNAIARTMAMSPAAVYRYFDSRDALLADLVVVFSDALADALAAAARDQTDPVERLAAVGRAYRSWALDNPNPYRLIFHTTSGSGQGLAPERTIPTATRSMDLVVAALAAAAPAAAEAGDQLRVLGTTWWTRLHGVVSLELGHHLASSTGVDPALVYEAELQELIRRARAPHPDGDPGRAPGPHDVPGGFLSFIETALDVTTARLPGTDRPAMTMVLLLHRVANSLVYDLESTVHRPAGWSWSAFRLLFVLWVAGPQEAGLAAELAGMSRAAVSSLARTLRGSGLVSSTPDTRDRRGVVLALTGAGSRRLESAFRVHNRREVDWAELLTPEELATLNALLAKLARAAQGQDWVSHRR